MAEPLLRIENLSKSFGAVSACRDISLEITEGETHALIGPNGAGKTTLLNQLAGDLIPDNGQIFLSGEEITHLPLHRRAHLGLARSYQITSVFPNTECCRESVARHPGSPRPQLPFLAAWP